MPPFDMTAPAHDIEDISGAFRIEAVARFDNLIGGYWQRIVDLGNGAEANNVILSQYENTGDMMFAVVENGAVHMITAAGAITEGETATWQAGVDPDGRMWIAKDGARLVEGQGVVPSDVPRASELVGESNSVWDDPLAGAVLGLDITNADEAEDGGRLNNPVPLAGAFRVDLTARFDDLSGRAWQGLFEATSENGEAGVRLTQVGASEDLMFEVSDGGERHQLIVEGALVEGEYARLAAGVEDDGTMWLENDGLRLAETQAVVPALGDGQQMVLGEAAGAGGDALDGVLLDLNVTSAAETGDESTSGGGDTLPDADTVTGQDTLPGDATIPGDQTPSEEDTLPDAESVSGTGGEDSRVAQVDGPFTLSLTARFDDIQGGYWQRMFDFGSGPGVDNILLTQVENTGGVMFGIWQGGEDHRVQAENAIVQGQTAEWSVGVEADGTMWIEKDGARIAEGQGVVPADVDRTNLLIGRSNWPEDDPLIGEVSGLTVAPLGDAGPEDTSGEADVTEGGGDSTGGQDTEPEEGGEDSVPAGTGEVPDGGDIPDGADLTAGGDMIIVAHQDDDILFMNPTIDDAIDGTAPVTTVYLTAGDFGLGQDYWGAREAGEKDAYGHMAGSDDWVDERVSVTVGDSVFDVASSYLESQPDVRLYFLRLPDGFDGSGSERYDFDSLQKLWEGSIDSAGTVDGQGSYTTEQLQGVITALMERHSPEQIHIQDHTSEHAELEHSDHVHAAEFAAAAAGDYSSDLTVTSYHGYATWGFEENVEGAELEDLRATFLEYAAHDPQVWESDGTLIDSYDEWLQREYVANEYTHLPSSAEMAALLTAEDDVPVTDDTAPEEEDAEPLML